MSSRHGHRYEARHEPLLPRGAFLWRLAHNVLYAGILIFGSLLLGMLGYHYFENLDWIDAFLNASMILSGMGPVAELHTTGGKLFAGFYALYSGLVVIASAAVLFAPILHRMIHKFHAEPEK